MSVKAGLPPIAREDARLFVLGSLPGDASLAAGRYYAHPRNHFWRLIGNAIGEDLQTLDYHPRLQRLAANRIGLWDVVARAERRGSLDQAIRDASHNPLGDYLAGLPELEAVAFNGRAAATLGRRLLGGLEHITLVDLPSSSPANTIPFVQKAARWAVLAQYCGA